MVWWCAEKVYPGKRFTRYAILGDDICIADDRVASLYRDTLDNLSISKSLISFSGAAEFAKKFRCRNLQVSTSDLSFKFICSIRNLLNSHHLPGALSLLNTYSAILDSGAVAWSRLQSLISSDSQHVGALSALACCLG